MAFWKQSSLPCIAACPCLLDGDSPYFKLAASNNSLLDCVSTAKSFVRENQDQGRSTYCRTTCEYEKYMTGSRSTNCGQDLTTFPNCGMAELALADFSYISRLHKGRFTLSPAAYLAPVWAVSAGTNFTPTGTYKQRYGC